MRSPGVLAAGTVAVVSVLAACGLDGESPPESWTPAASASVTGESQAEADSAMVAFTERMSDPNVTYRMSREVDIRPEEGGEGPRARVESRYDVASDDYAGFLQIRGHVIEAMPFPDVRVYAVDGTTHVWTGNAIPGQDWLEAETPASAQRPNAIADLEAADVVFVGRTGEGSFEFAVTPWIFGDPVLQWAELGILEADEVEPTTVVSHTTRLAVSADGAPQRLTSSWTFASADGGADVEGSTLVDQYSAMGLYVSITDADLELLPETSHDIEVGVDANRVIITEPWFDVAPIDLLQAELGVTFQWPDETDRPIVLGIEGAIHFVRAHDAGGTIVLDTKIPTDVAEVALPPGAQTIVVYYRTCDGNCALLGEPHDWCSVEATIEPGDRHELKVEILRRDHAACEVTPAGA